MKKILIILFCLLSLSAQAASYAVVDSSGKVVNVVEWDGNSPYSAPTGYTLVLDTNSPPIAGIGWTYEDGVFTPPSPLSQSPAKQAAAAFSAGLIISSTATPSLNGTYALDQASQNNVSATTTYILLNGTFPGGGTTMPWIDQTGVPHVWPSVAEFKAFATAYANYIANVSLYSASNGASGSLPSNTVTIP